MKKRIIKSFVLLFILLISTACSSENRLLVYREKCIFKDDYKFTTFDKRLYLKIPEHKNNDINPNVLIEDAIEFDNLELSQRALEIAKLLEGSYGSCIEIADKFLTMFYGRQLYVENSITVDNARPGDILYYTDGGLGVEHWGIYLNEQYSLQGNFNGSALIINGYELNNATYPIIRRIIE